MVTKIIKPHDFLDILGRSKIQTGAPVNTYSMSIYVVLHFEHKNEDIIIVKLCTELRAACEFSQSLVAFTRNEVGGTNFALSIEEISRFHI